MWGAGWGEPVLREDRKGSRETLFLPVPGWVISLFFFWHLYPTNALPKPQVFSPVCCPDDVRSRAPQRCHRVAGASLGHPLGLLGLAQSPGPSLVAAGMGVQACLLVPRRGGGVVCLGGSTSLHTAGDGYQPDSSSQWLTEITSLFLFKNTFTAKKDLWSWFWDMSPPSSNVFWFNQHLPLKCWFLSCEQPGLSSVTL